LSIFTFSGQLFQRYIPALNSRTCRQRSVSNRLPSSATASAKPSKTHHRNGHGPFSRWSSVEHAIPPVKIRRPAGSGIIFPFPRTNCAGAPCAIPRGPFPRPGWWRSQLFRVIRHLHVDIDADAYNRVLDAVRRCLTSSKIPQTFLPLIKTSFGHLSWHCAPTVFSMLRCTANAANMVRKWRYFRSGYKTTLTAILPSGDTHSRFEPASAGSLAIGEYGRAFGIYATPAAGQYHWWRSH